MKDDMNKVYYTGNHIKGFLLEIIRQMSASGYKPDYIAAINRGGVNPGVKLSHYLNVPLYVLHKDESNLWMVDDALEGKNILVIDDINDTGKTWMELQQDWACSNTVDWDKIWHNNVKYAVCIENTASISTADFVGLEINKIENPEWCVFPWEEWWLHR